MSVLAALKTHSWAYPALEVVHIAGIALVIGNLVLLELRVFGLGRALPARDLARLCLSLAGVGFGLVAASGLVMFATQATELLANRAFTLKMVLLMLAGCNAAWFHGRDSLVKMDNVARVLMVASTLLWLAMAASGRWIAYI